MSPASNGSKVVSMAEAAALVPDDAVVGVGGVMEQMVPVAFLLGLVRRRARGLHCVTVAAGLSVDLLVAGRCAAEVSCAIVSFEDLGTSRLFRRRVEGGELAFNEHLPTRAALGTDIPRANPGVMKVVDCPFTGKPLVACAALAPDVSVIHVHRVDASGNAQLDSKHIWHDLVIARAARRVIVSAEELVDEEVVRGSPERTVLPAFVVDAVVVAPRGAAPTMCPGRYDSDKAELRSWLEASESDEAITEFLADWVARG